MPVETLHIVMRSSNLHSVHHVSKITTLDPNRKEDSRAVDMTGFVSSVLLFRF